VGSPGAGLVADTGLTGHLCQPGLVPGPIGRRLAGRRVGGPIGQPMSAPVPAPVDPVPAAVTPGLAQVYPIGRQPNRRESPGQQARGESSKKCVKMADLS